MKLFGRRQGAGTGSAGQGTGGSGTRGSSRSEARAAARADEEHLTAFARSRPGVEAFVEPPTALTPSTVVFVATTGEWTRRRMRDAATAHALANRLGVPSYDAAVVGYPQRMRAWTSRQAAAQRDAG